VRIDPLHPSIVANLAGMLREDGETHRAVELLKRYIESRRGPAPGRAVAAGWRDYYLRRNDPYWAVVQDRPAFRELIEKVKADVDRQRAEVERIDAREDFMAKLDAVKAARARPE
jgi:hypothetical protein